MKWFLRLLAVLAVLAVLVLAVFAGAYLLPREVAVTRQTVIAAQPEAVFPYVDSLKRMQAWSPWLERDPAASVVFEGPDTGVGARMTWASDNPQVGSGSQEIVESRPNEAVVTRLAFDGMGGAEAALLLAPSGETMSEVTWTLKADMGNSPMGRWMGLMMDRWVGADYEAGLAKLKALVEGGAGG